MIGVIPAAGEGRRLNMGAEPLVGDEHMFIILGDIVYRGDDIQGMKQLFEWNRNSLYCVFAIKPARNPEEIKASYGLKFISTLKPVEIIEKPKTVEGLSPFVGLGIYAATPDLFSYIEKTPASPLRNEVEITDTLNLMARDLRAGAYVLNGFYCNVNTAEDLRRVERKR